MAPTRRGRSPNGAKVHYEEDSDAPSDPETPRPQKSHHKKRLSEAYIPDGDSSFTENSGARVPLKSVNINDDEAEKRRRRKSTKITVPPVAGPSSEMGGEASMDASRSMGRRQQPLNSVAPEVTQKKPIAILSSNFEEWMKMATDNKINTANTWNFALIDYFHDMSLLRNTDDNSINFQRASCTLDGCVKIWTSRVDSIGAETGKLLSNLASGGTGEDEDEENDSDNPDAGPSQKKKKSSRAGNSNLVKDYKSLQIQKLDLEFSVDPLFKKTCADFDEGGAQGLLMNHLSLGLGSDGGMRVIFDAGDSVFTKQEEEIPDDPVDLIDLSELKAQFLPDLSVLEDKAISHSLQDFSFDKGLGSGTSFFGPTDFDDVEDSDSDDGPAGGDLQMDVDQPPVEDFFNGAGDDDAFGGGNDGGDDYEAEGHSNESVGPPGDGEGHVMGPTVPFDPRHEPHQRELLLSMDADDEGALDYFDSKFRKNWAGPEHWKLRRTIRKPEVDNANKGVKRTKKEPVRIDFLAPAEKDLKALKEELFAPPGKNQSINMAATGTGKKGKKAKKDKSDHRLPDDMHFSSKQLVTLFLKPKFFLKMRGKRARVNNDDGEIDENFWAQAAAEQARAREGEREDDTEGNIPFSTQFFNDDDDDGPSGFDFDGGLSAMGQEPGEQDLLAATAAQTRRVKPEVINYAKRAKRVDVRKLKENIWKNLDIVIKKTKLEGEDVDMVDGDDDDPNQPPATDPSEARQFSQVISGLTKTYPREKMEEISTSFCFICLLHLANEQGLKLEASTASDAAPIDSIIPEDEDDMIAEGKPGDLWGIKIYRDPNATQSA